MLNKPTILQEIDWNKILLNDKDFNYHASIIGKANGTFGELLQGVLPNEEHYLITFPINCFTQCIFIVDKNSSTVTVTPSTKKKSLLLAKNILRYFNIHTGGKLIIKSDLVEGKGLASSSADLVATAKAMELTLKKPINTQLLLELLREIEPTDGVMYPGIVSFYHKRVTLREFLGTLPSITIIGIDEGGIVDTIEYNKKERFFTLEEKNEYEHLLINMSHAIKKSDLKQIGEISTRSAVMNQNNNPKKYLSQFIDICNEVKGIGVIVAHSGTCIGIMLETDDVMFESKLQKTRTLLNKISSSIDIYESVSFINSLITSPCHEV